MQYGTAIQILEEIESIDSKLSFLNPSNYFERQTRKNLLIRLNVLDKRLDKLIFQCRKEQLGLRVVCNS